jgi:hypothetical protein
MVGDEPQPLHVEAAAAVAASDVPGTVLLVDAGRAVVTLRLLLGGMIEDRSEAVPAPRAHDGAGEARWLRFHDRKRVNHLTTIYDMTATYDGGCAESTAVIADILVSWEKLRDDEEARKAVLARLMENRCPRCFDYFVVGGS